MMNKQEVDSLIANNSIRMTNRQWLESLSDEELAKRIRSNNDLSTMTRADNTLFELCAAAGGLYSREMAVIAWLRAEHKEG